MRGGRCFCTLNYFTGSFSDIQDVNVDGGTKDLHEGSESLNENPESLQQTPEDLNGTPPVFSEVSQPPFEDVTHTIDHEETVNIVTVEQVGYSAYYPQEGEHYTVIFNFLHYFQAIGRRVVVTCPDGQLMSMIVLPPERS